MKLTITLSPEAEKYFHEVMYSLDDGDGKLCTQSKAINHSLEILALFEKDNQCDLLHYMVHERPDVFKSAVEYCNNKQKQSI